MPLYRIQPSAQMAVFFGSGIAIPEIQPSAQMAVFISVPGNGDVFWDVVILFPEIHYRFMPLYRIQPSAQMAVFFGSGIAIPEIQPFARMPVTMFSVYFRRWFSGLACLQSTAKCTKGNNAMPWCRVGGLHWFVLSGRTSRRIHRKGFLSRCIHTSYLGARVPLGICTSKELRNTFCAHS